MCKDNQGCTCECFQRGGEEIVDGFMAWAHGDHGDDCRCSTCQIAVKLMVLGFPRVARLCQQSLEEPPAPPAPPTAADDTMGVDADGEF